MQRIHSEPHWQDRLNSQPRQCAEDFEKACGNPSVRFKERCLCHSKLGHVRTKSWLELWRNPFSVPRVGRRRLHCCCFGGRVKFWQWQVQRAAPWRHGPGRSLGTFRGLARQRTIGCLKTSVQPGPEEGGDQSGVRNCLSASGLLVQLSSLRMANTDSSFFLFIDCPQPVSTWNINFCRERNQYDFLLIKYIYAMQTMPLGTIERRWAQTDTQHTDINHVPHPNPNTLIHRMKVNRANALAPSSTGEGSRTLSCLFHNQTLLNQIKLTCTIRLIQFQTFILYFYKPGGATESKWLKGCPIFSAKGFIVMAARSDEYCSNVTTKLPCSPKPLSI